MKLHVNLAENGYDIIIERGVLSRASEELKLERKVLIVTDSGVPKQYAETVAAKCAHPVIVTVPEGEGSKSFSMLEALCRKMLEEGFTRTDCAVAVGGGVVGDLTGFAAASFMRGIDFYNIPTTLLSQVDSSVGGKVAVNLDSVKNIVGSFYQPKKVLIDPDVLSTLPRRQIAAGLAESLKMSLTSDKELYEIFKAGKAESDIEEVIRRSLLVKINVVEQDEKETGLRKVLNFGHTLGHGIEGAEGLSGFYHGECVALGMIPMCSDEMRPELIRALEKLGLPTSVEGNIEKMLDIATHDKKCDGGSISVVFVNTPGSFEFKKMPIEDFKSLMRERFSQYIR
ncbi:MAG: 3-dehydroquinate synthase [Clostridia bacterium]|nr:3-dehydroquinate synthase [Clostridia bacterium]